MSGVKRGRHREAEPHDHAGRIVLDRIVDVLADVGEGDDLVALGRDLRARQAEQRRREIDIGEPRILGMKARAELEQRADAPAAFDQTARRRDDAGDDLQQRRFAGAVLADDAQRLAGGEVERDFVQRLEYLRSAASAQEIEDQPQPAGIGIELRVVLADAGEVEQCGHARVWSAARRA